MIRLASAELSSPEASNMDASRGLAAGGVTRGTAATAKKLVDNSSLVVAERGVNLIEQRQSFDVALCFCQ